LQIKVTNCPRTDEIDAYNGNLVVAIIEVIAGNMIPTKNHLNHRQTGTKNCGKKRWVPSPCYLRQKHRRGRRRENVGGGMVTARP
jgi:hypothetical protein